MSNTTESFNQPEETEINLRKFLHLFKQPTTVETAKVSTVPISLSVPTNTAIGVLLGRLLFVAYMIIQFTFNDHICTEEDIYKYLGFNTLAIVPYEKGLDSNYKKCKLFHKKNA